MQHIKKIIVKCVCIQYGKQEEQYQASEYSSSCLSEKEQAVSLIQPYCLLTIPFFSSEYVVPANRLQLTNLLEQVAANHYFR